MVRDVREALGARADCAADALQEAGDVDVPQRHVQLQLRETTGCGDDRHRAELQHLLSSTILGEVLSEVLHNLVEAIIDLCRCP